jgi:hypothetical protein
MTITNDLSQERFGKLTVIEPTDRRQGNCVMWLCKCDCGNETVVNSSRLRAGKSQSCGCSRKINLKGERSGKLVAIEPTLLRKGGGILWRCQCDCGGEINATSTEILNSLRKSCGCVKAGRKKAVKKGFNGVRQAGSEWVAFHPVIGDISTHGSEHDAACAVRDWLINNPDFQLAWPLRGYPE